ncbi:MAG TPA: MbtH family NRPS accessory protein [Candidatus Angelobacter sp.]|jgi:uncharacterized protein YbdZ (MbtH family)
MNAKTDTDYAPLYRVVVNDEEQYSIWPAHRTNPPGWHDTVKTGFKEECLAYVKEVWTDMMPLSLRRKMDEAQRHLVESAAEDEIRKSTRVDDKDDLVYRLSQKDQPVELSLSARKSTQAFRDRIEQGLVHLKFTGTQGYTELGIDLDREAVKIQQADFENRTGTVHLEGTLTLNFQKVRCIADIDLETLTGRARLRLIEAKG